MPKKKLEITSFISGDGGEFIRFEELIDGQRDEFIKKTAKNIGRNLSRYFSENPDEARKLFGDGK